MERPVRYARTYVVRGDVAGGSMGNAYRWYIMLVSSLGFISARF